VQLDCETLSLSPSRPAIVAVALGAVAAAVAAEPGTYGHAFLRSRNDRFKNRQLESTGFRRAVAASQARRDD